VQAALAGQRPSDGYFVEFWRLLVEYPEILAWDRFFDEGKHQVLAEVNATVKAVRADLQVGFHIEHVNSFNPIFRATRRYDDLAKKADFLKVVAYNNCGGERYANFIRNVGSTVFRDVPRDELLRLNNHLLNYGSEAGLGELATAGLADYVARKRSAHSTGQGAMPYPARHRHRHPDRQELAQGHSRRHLRCNEGRACGGRAWRHLSRSLPEMRLANSPSRRESGLRIRRVENEMSVHLQRAYEQIALHPDRCGSAGYPLRCGRRRTTTCWNPADHLPPHISQLTSFGERADWSHDGKKILFLSKTFGDAMEIDVETKTIRNLTAHFPHYGYTRALT
jgi:hypothetical protein